MNVLVNRIEFSLTRFRRSEILARMSRKCISNAPQRIEEVFGHQQQIFPTRIFYAGDPVDKKKEKMKKQKKEKEDAKKNKSTPVTKDEKPSVDKKK